MTIQKMNIGTWEEGTPLAGQTKWHFYSDDPVNDPLHAVVTGPVSGLVTINHDGEDHTYDVSPIVIEAPPEHHQKIVHEIGLKHEQDGHPGHKDGTPFVHECPGGCPDDNSTSAGSGE